MRLILLPRTYFPFYFTFYESAQTMKPKMRAAFYEAIIEYGVTSNKPTLPSSIAGYWPMIKKALDTSKQRYDAEKKAVNRQKKAVLVQAIRRIRIMRIIRRGRIIKRIILLTQRVRAQPNKTGRMFLRILRVQIPPSC